MKLPATMLKTLHYDDVDITGFAGVREMILVMDPEVFSRRPDEVWPGHGQLIYLAHAYFRPLGSTGRHFHEGIDIVSILTRGRVLHEGTAGHGKAFAGGQVMVQRSGEAGFAHDEINQDADITGMVQIWMRPEGDIPQQSSHILLDLQPGMNRVYEGVTSDIIIQVMKEDEALSARPGDLAYVYQGSLICGEQILSRGSLFKFPGIGKNTNVKALNADTRVVFVSHTNKAETPD